MLSMLLYNRSINIGMFGPPISDKAVRILAEFFLFFLFGNLTALFLTYVPQRSPAYQYLQETDEKISKVIKISKILLIIFIITVSVKLYYVYSMFGNPLSPKNIVSIRATLTSGGLDFGLVGLLPNVICNLLVLNLGVLIVTNRTSKIIMMTLCVFTFQFISDICQGGIIMTFISAVLFATTIFFALQITNPERLRELPRGRRQRIKSGNIKTLSFLIITAVPVMYFMDARQLGNAEMYGLPVSLANTATFYFGGNISSFSYFLEHPYPSVPIGRQTWGGIYWFLNDFVRLVGLEPLMIPDVPEDFHAPIITSVGGAVYNTSIFLSDIYSDFGEIGVIIITFILGYLITFLLMRANYNKRMLSIQLASLVMFIVVMGIRAFPPAGRYFWVLIIAIYLQNKLSFKYKPRSKAIIEPNSFD